MTSPLLTAHVSVFQGTKRPVPIERRPLAEQLDRIKNGIYQPQIDQLRQLWPLLTALGCPPLEKTAIRPLVPVLDAIC